MRAIVDKFLLARPQLSSPKGAESQCAIATQALAGQLCATDIPAAPVWVRGHRRLPKEASPRALKATRHQIVCAPGVGFMDVTRRQFEPTGTHPRYYSSESDLACDWRELDAGPFDGSVEQEDWRSLALAPWDLGLAGKGLLLRNGQFRCWSLNANDAPHHDGGLRALNLEPRDVEAYVTLSPRGEVGHLEGSDQAVLHRILTADARLRAAAPGWRF